MASMAASWMELPKTASGCGDAGAGEGGCFALVGGDVDEGVGDDAVDDVDAGGEDAVGGDAEARTALFDDPVVGGADGPDARRCGCGGRRRERLISGKMFLVDAGWKEGTGGGADLFFAEALVHLDHLAADGDLGDLAAVVEAIAVVDPVGGLAGDEAGLDGPVHEAGAGVAGPEGAVAVEDGDCGGEVEDGAVELGWR